MNHYSYTLKRLDDHANITTVGIACDALDLNCQAMDYLANNLNCYIIDANGDGYANSNGTFYKFSLANDKGQIVVIDQMLEPTANGVIIHPSNIRRLYHGSGNNQCAN